ncbi:MAG: AI-2E family transporter [Fimbriimonadales bacterium]
MYTTEVPEHQERVVIRGRPRTWLFWILAVALALYVVYVVREIWLPLGIAFLIAMVLDPVVDRMEHRGFSRFLSSLVIFVGFFAALAGLLYFVVPRVAEQAKNVSQKATEYLPDRSPQGIERFLNRNHVPYSIRPVVSRAITQIDSAIAGAAKWLGENALHMASNLIWLVIIPIVAFSALKDFHLILAKTLLLVPKGKREFVQTMVSESTAVFAKFMRGMALVSFLNGLTTWLVLVALGVEGALLLGIVAMIVYPVPYFGALITVALIAGVSFVTGGLNQMLIVVGANVILQQIIFDQIVTPRILGRSVGLHPIWSIFALLVGNALLGLIGMILAVPVAACIQIAIVSVVPKLGYEIDVSAPGANSAVEELSEETKNEHIEATASEELHGQVTSVVEDIEAQEQESP